MSESKVVIIDDIKAAIIAELGSFIGDSIDEIKPVIDGAVYTGKDDPGQWAPKAIAVIHCESGIPSGYYDSEIQDSWTTIENQLQEMGYNIYIETINAAVKAFYPI